MKEEGSDLFTCAECDSSFVTKWSLDSHTKAFHPLLKVTQTVARPLVQYQSHPRLRRKTIIKREDETFTDFMYPCQLCNQQFETEDEWDVHFSAIHSEVTITLANAPESNIRKGVSLLKRPMTELELETDSDVKPKLRVVKVGQGNDNSMKLVTKHKQLPTRLDPLVLNGNFEINDVVRTLLISHMNAESEREAAAAAIKPGRSAKFSVVTRSSNSESDSDEDEFEGESSQASCSVEEDNGSALTPLVELSVHGGEFHCNECGAKFRTEYQLERHIEHHNAVSRPHKCPICGDNRGFVRKEHLAKHMSSVHSGLKFTCEFCGKDISRRDHLVRHIRSVHRCPIPPGLDLLAAAASSLQGATATAPSRAKLDEISDKTLLSMQPKPKKPYTKCDMCSATFTQLEALFQHQRVAHSDIRKYNCEFCSKSFKRREHLQKHVVLHTGEKKFTCTYCAKSFPRRDALQDHLRRIHGALHADSEEFSCTLCDKVFFQHSKLVRHRNQVHNITLAVANANQPTMTRKPSEYVFFKSKIATSGASEPRRTRPPVPALLPIDSFPFLHQLTATKVGKN